MRIWSLDPKYLDSKGLCGCWRECLGAKKALEATYVKKKCGYQNHSQLVRFRAEKKNMLKYINTYLHYLLQESKARGYNFDESKIDKSKVSTKLKMNVTSGQVEYEFTLLKNKLLKRDPLKHTMLNEVKEIEVNPMFNIIDGAVEEWEVVK